MDLTLALLPAMFFVGWICFNIGQYTKSSPDEAEMMRRLVRSRVERKLKEINESDVQREIESASGRVIAARGAL